MVKLQKVETENIFEYSFIRIYLYFNILIKLAKWTRV